MILVNHHVAPRLQQIIILFNVDCVIMLHGSCKSNVEDKFHSLALESVS